ncbi:MAG: hypothetical protein WCP97_03650 [bacterium]
MSIDTEFTSGFNRFIPIYLNIVCIENLVDGEAYERCLKETYLGNLCKLVRNKGAFERLALAGDRIKDIVFYLAYLESSFEFLDENYKREIAEVTFIRSLTYFTPTPLYAFINFLAYFFDFPQEEYGWDSLNYINYLYLANPAVAKIVYSFFQQDLVKEVVRRSKTIKSCSEFLTKIEVATSPLSITVNMPQDGFKLDEVISRNKNFLGLFITTFIPAIFEELKQYKDSRGFNSLRDIKIVDGIVKQQEEHERDIPVKIFNFKSLERSIEDVDFTIKPNINYKELEKEFFQPSDVEVTKITIGSHSKMDKQVVTKNEGQMLWTHTIFFNKKNVKAIFEDSEIAEDICLILSFLSARGIFTEKECIHFSHKSEIPRLFPLSESTQLRELHKNVIDLIKKIRNFESKKKNLVFELLNRYRNLLHLKDTKKLIINLYEIIDVCGSRYCHDVRGVEEKMKKFLKKNLELHKICKIEESYFTFFIKEIACVRGKSTHGSSAEFSSEDSKKFQNTKIKSINDMVLMNYFYALSDLVYIVICLLLDTSPEPIKTAKLNLKQFCEDKSKLFFTNEIKKRRANDEEKMKEIEKFMNGNFDPSNDGDFVITF